MNITEEMIQAGINAEAAVLKLQESHRIEWEPIVRKTVIAALTAALGDVEPLEDVLGMGYWVSITTKRTDSTWIAVVGDHDTGRLYNGYGPTIDAAIRAAVANAEGEGS